MKNNNNNLPKGWRKVKLGELTIPGGSVSGPFGSDIKSIYFRSTGVPIIRGNNLTMNIDRGRYIDDGYIFLDPKRFEELKKAEALPEDIIITARGTIGQTGIISRNSKYSRYIISANQLRFRIDKQKADPLFVYYQLSSKYITQQMQNYSVNVGVPNFNLTAARNLEILIPEDINEQKRIAKILSAFDDKIELNNKIIKTLEEMAQEIFEEWFVRFRFPGWQKVKFVDSELGKIPEGWKATTLEEIMNLRREKFKSYNEWKNEKLLDLGRFPQKSLAINNYGKGEEIKTSAFKFYKGDILFGAVRPYFHKVVIAPFDGVTNQSVFVIFPKKQEFYSYLITILFSESTINYATNMASGTKMPVLKYEDLANMNIVLPDFKILSIFNEMVDKFYNILIEKVEENQKLAELRDLLLPKLMSGELLVKSEERRVNN
jgi:type I restriction enzyme S subunit